MFLYTKKSRIALVLLIIEHESNAELFNKLLRINLLILAIMTLSPSVVDSLGVTMSNL